MLACNGTAFDCGLPRSSGRFFAKRSGTLESAWVLPRSRNVIYSNCKREREKGTGFVPNPTENLAKRQLTVPVPLSRGP
jgi:hypothetical protein